jgi:hypothetical protein
VTERSIRRLVGYLLARLPEVGFDEVSDPRRGPTKWRLPQLLTAALVGAMAGCRGLHDVEEMTDSLSPSVRRRLGLSRRQPDTTLRDAICAVSVDELRGCLRRVVHAAFRRKALCHDGLPFGVLAMDGKSTSLPCWDEEHVQRVQPAGKLPYGLARTVTCTLVSAAGKPCLDAIPIPAHTNEVGHFQTAFDQVREKFGSLFQLVTYDAGALSEENGRHVVESGKHYLIALKGDQRTMFKLADELFDPSEVSAVTLDVLDSRRSVTRRLSVLTVEQSWAYGNGKGAMESVWQHARTFLRVRSETRVDGVVVSSETRMYVTSLDSTVLAPQLWMKVIRSH